MIASSSAVKEVSGLALRHEEMTEVANKKRSATPKNAFPADA